MKNFIGWLVVASVVAIFLVVAIVLIAVFVDSRNNELSDQCSAQGGVPIRSVIEVSCVQFESK